MVSVVSIPVVVVIFWQPDVGSFSSSLPNVLFGVLVVFGCTGALVAILERAGVIQFRYTDDDKRRLHHRMAKFIAEMEHGRSRSFSPRYYESYGLTPPNPKRRDDKPAA